MEKKMFKVQGHLLLPLDLNIQAESQQAAIEYAMSIFNKNNIVKLEADLYDRSNKSHYMIADLFEFCWHK